jgi:hypothetical protein
MARLGDTIAAVCPGLLLLIVVVLLVNGPYLTGVMTSRRGGASTAKVGTELVWFRSKISRSVG